MKNFKKIIILSIITFVIVIYFIYDYMSNTDIEVIEEKILVEEGDEIEQTNIIILHITGEVNIPRNY